MRACAVPKRIAVVRAGPDVDRDAFVAGLQRLDPAELYVTEAGPRPATAIVCASGAEPIPQTAGTLLATYEVADHVMWDEPIDGDVHSMFAFFRFPNSVDEDEAVARYREHAELARVHHPGIRRYIQDLVEHQSGEDRWVFSAISELHFAGPDEYRERFWRDEASRDVIARDVERFSDVATAKTVVAPRVS